MTQAQRIIRDLKQHSHPERVADYMRFFKTGKGEYGEGDTFLGLSVPETRSIAKKYPNTSLDTLDTLLASQYHEVRFCALVILVGQYQNGIEATRRTIYDFYLSHTNRINNWDLVDVTAHKIVGTHLIDKNRRQLYKLAKSNDLWERRISIIATFAFLPLGDLKDALALAELHLQDEHDLMHKAVGWVLREVGKIDRRALNTFLDMHASQMPRTMLRYALEKHPDSERKRYMKR